MNVNDYLEVECETTIQYDKEIAQITSTHPHNNIKSSPIGRESTQSGNTAEDQD
uniref:Uncharacterized protein n=1 Tax=Anguilla anguilla TaxID=7936 RepID=A0A0E9R0S1_ANGAN